MSNGAGSEAHPLFFHSIVLFIVAALVVVTGVLGIVAAARTSDVSVKAPTSLRDLQQMQSQQRMAASDARTLARKPTGLSGAMMSAQSASRLGAKGKAAAGAILPFIVPIVIILAGAATGAAGFFLLKRKNWARFAGFGLVAAVLVYYTWMQSAANALVDPTDATKFLPFQAWRPIVLIVIAALAGKFLFDLWVEKLKPVEQPAA